MTDSTRTKKLKEAKIEDDFLGIKKGVKAFSVKASEIADKMGYTQEDEYKKPPEKKAKGGWIQSAIKKPGSLRKSLGVKKGEKIPASKLSAAAKKPGKMGQKARLAQTLKGLKK
jgi:hypothetical protein